MVHTGWPELPLCTNKYKNPEENSTRKEAPNSREKSREKMAMVRSLYRSICFRYLCSSSAAANHHQHLPQGLYYFHLSLSSSSPLSIFSQNHPFRNCQPPFTMAIGSTRFFSEDVTHFPDIKDPEILFVFKDLTAASWDELPDTLISDAKKALSKNTDDEAAQEAVANVFRTAKAVEEFSGMLVSLRMAIDDSTGLGGENVKPLPEEFVNALHTVYQRYTAYLDAFGPEETYLRKKVETELGTEMIHLKMRCSGIGSEWGKLLQFWGLLDFQVPMLSIELSFLEMVKSIMSSRCLFSWGTSFVFVPLSGCKVLRETCISMEWSSVKKIVFL
ncbi:unnamed protein product [Camellia sinensis]